MLSKKFLCTIRYLIYYIIYAMMIVNLTFLNIWFKSYFFIILGRRVFLISLKERTKKQL